MRNSNTLIAVVALAMLASTAQATYMMDKFIEVVDAPSVDTVVNLVIWQSWAFLAPFVGGPLRLWIYVLWYGGSTFNYNGDAIAWPVILGFIGIGNFTQLY